jgi:hypothetical protein
MSMLKKFGAALASAALITTPALGQTTVMGGKFNKRSMKVVADDSLPVACLWSIHDGSQEFNNLPIGFKLYYSGTATGYPQYTQSVWDETAINILSSHIVGYRGYTNDVLGFADHAYSKVNPKEILDVQVYENAHFYWYAGGISETKGFDCDRANGLQGFDYRSHVMHEIGHGMGLLHWTGGSSPSCMMARPATENLIRNWCTGEKDLLAKAYLSIGFDTAGVTYDPSKFATADSVE